MTEHLKITATIPRKRYVADGTQTVFSFDFVLFQPSELLVTVNGAAIASGVAVSLLADGTGIATFAVAPAANAIVVLQRRVTIKRETDFQEGGELRAKTLNDEFDFQTAALQQVETAAARALQLPIDDADNAATVLPIAAVRATKMLGFDASGNPTLSNQTLAQIEAGSSAAAASAAAAATSQNAAATSATNAANSQGVAAANAATATARASEAATSAAAASTSAEAAAIAQTGSDASATAAATSSANAATSATAASNSASAASTSATDAASSQTTAANAATNAASSATAAATSATNAQTYAADSGTQATAAAASAVAAATSAASIALPLPLASGGTGASTEAAARTNLGLGSAATLTAGTAANQVPQLDGLARLPAVDGSLLTNVAGASIQVTAGEALTIYDLIYQDVFNQRGFGADRWYKVDTDATAPVRISPRIGIALAAIASGASGAAQARSGRVSGFSGLTAGQAVFASATAGAVTQTAPAIPASGTQNATRLIGYAASATEIDFDPEDDTVFTARNSSVAVDGTLTVQHWVDTGGREREQAAYLVQVSSTAAVSGGTGTSIGDFTSAAGLAAVFNGFTSQSIDGSGTKVGTSGYVGKTYSPGKSIQQAVVYGSSDAGYVRSINPTVTLVLRGKTGTAPASRTDGTQFGTLSFTDTGNESASPRTVASTDQTTVWNHVWIDFSHNGASNECAIAEITFTEVSGTARDEPLTIGGSIANATATDRVNVRYDDGAGANADTRTTFINRTGATRDLACEVVL